MNVNILIQFWEAVVSGKRNRPGRPRASQDKFASMHAERATKLRKHEEACEKIYQMIGAGGHPTRRRRNAKSKDPAGGACAPIGGDADAASQSAVAESTMWSHEVTYQYTQDSIRTGRTVRGPGP